MNVSKTADAEFRRLLELEDPRRYEQLQKTIRKDTPNESMSEEQALTNFMLGLATGQFRFKVIAGAPAPEPISQKAAAAIPKSKAGRRQGSKDHSSVRRQTRLYASNADKQRAYRQRQSVTS